MTDAPFRSNLKGGRRPRHVHTDFLPAALEVLETPPRPLGRIVLWVIIVAAISALLWSVFSKVEIVAVSEGRIVPRGRLQVVEAADPGVVRAITIREGDTVKAGQILLELDSSVAGAETSATRSQYDAALLTKARASALLGYAAAGQAGDRSVSFKPPADSDQNAIAAELRLARAQTEAFEARRSALISRMDSAAASKEMVARDLEKLLAMLPILERQIAARRELVRKGLSPKLNLMEYEQQLIDLNGQIEIRRADADRAAAEVDTISGELDELRKTFLADAAAELSQAEATIAGRAAAVARAEQREGYQVLTAPVDGVVNEVAVSTLGEVVAAGDPLVTIVPNGQDLIVESMILNRDRGFLQVGDRVRVKVEAFPYTRYGHIEGVVAHISADAIADERKGLVYPARVTLSRGSLLADGRNIPLAPGLVVQVEAVTGERRVIDFILSPIAKSTTEAGRER